MPSYASTWISMCMTSTFISYCSTEFPGNSYTHTHSSTPLGACLCNMDHCAADLAAPLWDTHPMKVVEANFQRIRVVEQTIGDAYLQQSVFRIFHMLNTVFDGWATPHPLTMSSTFRFFIFFWTTTLASTFSINALGIMS